MTSHGIRPRHRRSSAVDPARRLLVLALLGALVAAGAVVDRSVGPPTAHVAAVAGAAGPDATSSAWYCPLVRAQSAAPADGSVVISNVGDAGVSGAVTIYPQSGGAAVRQPVAVGPRARVELQPGRSVDAAYASVTVEVDGGGVVVDHVDRSASGTTSAPCATRPSAAWYSAEGSTESGASLTLGLFNPFPEDAIVDVSFATSSGATAPVELQGIVVAARSSQRVEVADRVRRRDWVATTVGVRGGRVIAEQLQDGMVAGARGTALTPMAPGPASTWSFADGSVAEGVVDRITLLDPGDAESVADVRVVPDQGDPVVLTLHVPRHGRAAVDLDRDNRVPRGVPYTVSVRVVSGPAVVAARRAASGAPSATIGASISHGVAAGTPRWGIGAGWSAGPATEVLAVLNPGDRVASMSVRATGEGKVVDASGAKIDPGHRLLVDVDDLTGGADRAVVVTSDVPVVVSRTQSYLPAAGLASGPAVALR